MHNGKKGFTLIELLVVIGLLAVLSAGVITLIDPLEKTRQAQDAGRQNSIGEVAVSMQASAAQDTMGYYPQPSATGNGVDAFVTIGELKRNPGGVTYVVNANPATAAVAYTTLTAKKFLSKCGTNVPYWMYVSSNGRSCGICLGSAPTAATVCPGTAPF